MSWQIALLMKKQRHQRPTGPPEEKRSCHATMVEIANLVKVNNS